MARKRPPNTLYYGDNLDVLRRHLRAESVDLIYLDPPFNSNRSYNVLFKQKSGAAAQAQIQAFDDTWIWSHESERQYQELLDGGAPVKVADAVEALRRLLGENDMLAYLVMMTARLLELHRVLKSTGSLYLHCDPTASHYLKVVLDTIFGAVNFRNEIVWSYRGAQNARRTYPRKHDVVLWYSKSDDYTFNGEAVAEGFSAAQLSRYNVVKADGTRWANMKGKLRQLNPAGRIPTDVWELPMLTNNDKERRGYPTQKPLALLERILAAGSNPGDVVLDPFCGCGTSVDAAQKLGRRWVGIDVTYIAVDLIRNRLRDRYGEAALETFAVRGIPTDAEGAAALASDNPLDFERWAVSLVEGQGNERQVGDKGIDGVVRFHTDGKGGTGRILVSVKGGRQIGPAMVRDLSGTVRRDRAAGGVLITLGKPTRGMVEEAKHSGLFDHKLQGKSYPRLQLISVVDLLQGKRLTLPPTVPPYMKAERVREVSEQLEL